jgi:N-acetyl-anhydromuramyl-L-alanine amidase AmpD
MKRNILFLILSSILITSCSINISYDTDNVSSFNNQVNIPKPEVIVIESQNRNDRPPDTKISTIVLHHTATSSDAKSVANFFANPQSKVSSHYIVDRSGYIVQCVPDDKVSWHAGKSQFNGVENVNNFSIGIEICNLGDSLEPYPEVQYDSIIRLVAYLVKTYDIPITNITRHRDIAIPLGRKIDTSDNFSVQKVLDGVKQVLNGSYQSPIPFEPKPVNAPPFREIITKNNETSLEIIADIYLDNETRTKELELLNPNLKNIKHIPVGTKVKIPTDYSYFYKANVISTTILN